MMENNNNSNNSNYGPIPAPPPLPKFEHAHIPVRKPRAYWKIGGLLILAGLILFAAGWANGASGGRMYLDKRGFHFGMRGEDVGIVTRSIDSEPFDTVDIGTSFEDIYFLEGDSYHLQFKLPDDIEPSYELVNGRLTIQTEGEDGFQIDFMNFDFERSMESSITVYYPKGAQLNNVELTSMSGDITAELPDVDSVKLDTFSGDMDAVFYGRANVNAHTGSGSINLTNDGGEQIEAVVNTMSGEVEIDGNIWRDLNVEGASDSIDINGELYGQTKVKSMSGDISIHAATRESIGYDLSTVSGEIYLNGDEIEEEGIGINTSVSRDTAANNVITATNTSGDIELDVED